MSKVTTEVLRRVYVEEEFGVFLQVGPFDEAPDYLTISAPGEANTTWFGKFSPWCMTPKFARALGQALINSANDMEAK